MGGGFEQAFIRVQAGCLDNVFFFIKGLRSRAFRHCTSLFVVFRKSAIANIKMKFKFEEPPTSKWSIRSRVELWRAAGQWATNRSMGSPQN